MCENNVVFNKFNTAISELEADLDFTSPMSFWEYTVYGMDVSDAPYYELQALDRAINCIVIDLQTNYKNSSDTNQQCAVCGGIGNTFFECPSLKHTDKVK